MLCCWNLTRISVNICTQSDWRWAAISLVGKFFYYEQSSINSVRFVKNNQNLCSKETYLLWENIGPYFNFSKIIKRICHLNIRTRQPFLVKRRPGFSTQKTFFFFSIPSFYHHLSSSAHNIYSFFKVWDWISCDCSVMCAQTKEPPL